MTDEIGRQTLIVIENVGCHAVPLNLYIGDLYITHEGIKFISYSRTTVTRDMQAIIGGLAGALTGHVSDKWGIKEAKDTAKTLRSTTYGMTIGERASLHRNSISLARRNIARLACDKKDNVLTCIKNDGTSTEFIVPDLQKYEPELLNYPAGNILYDTRNDPHGLLLGFPSPKNVIKVFSSEPSNLQVTESTISDMATNEKYMFQIYSELIETDDDTKKLVSKEIAKTQPILALSLVNSIIKGTHEAKRGIWGMLLFGILMALLFGGGGIALLLFATYDAVGKILIWIFIAIGVFGIVFSMIKTRDDINRIQLNRELMLILKSPAKT